MILSWLLAAVHLVALGIGVEAILSRARLFSSSLDARSLKRLFAADARWGIAAILWISTGLWRAFAGLEKPSAYYWLSHSFWIKMALFFAILILEAWPAATLMRWRVASQRGEDIDTSRATLFGRISGTQFILLIAMIFAATAMARGLGN